MGGEPDVPTITGLVRRTLIVIKAQRNMEVFAAVRLSFGAEIEQP